MPVGLAALVELVGECGPASDPRRVLLFQPESTGEDVGVGVVDRRGKCL